MADAQQYINNIKEAVLDAVKVNYFQFEGRAARPAFWWCYLALVVFYLVLGLLNIDILVTLAALALLMPSLGIAVRRLHDINMSGWFVILMLIPVVGLILAIYWGTRPGTDGPNNYGPAPTNPNISTTGKA